MKTLAKISDFAGKYMAIIALAVAMIALVFPAVSAVVKTSYVNILLGVVMFGMGMTLKLADFKVVFTKPKAVIVGILAQFVIMPVLAFLLTMVFQLPPELAVGVILVGSCPGGTSSNVMTYLAKGDVALSVGMTACTTIMAPIVTPLLVLLFAGQTVDVNVVDMFLSIVQVVLVPIALGFLINYFFEKAARAASAVLPLVSVVGISLIIMAVVAANQAKLLTVGRGDAAQPAWLRAGIPDRAGAAPVEGPDAHAVHRGGHAELRPGHLARHGTLRSHAAGCGARCRVQRVAQHLRRSVREHSRPLGRQRRRRDGRG